MKASMDSLKRRDLMSHKCGLRKTIFFLNGDRYVGEWFNNKMHGKGTYVWKSSNSTYHGEWVRGQRCGHGVLSVAAAPTAGKPSCQYVGQWRNDFRHGHGTNIYENGELYEGEWALNERHGHGRMKYADGSIYEGHWKRDVRGGNGKLTSANGDIYEGEWANDLKHGHGRYVFTSKNLVLESTWLNGIPKEGELITTNTEML